MHQICLYLSPEMKNLLKYLVFIVAAVIFQDNTERSVTSVQEKGVADMSFIEEAYHSVISETDSELCLPRQVSFANSFRAQSTVRRTNTAHRNNFEFAKAGKIVNAGLRYSIQHQSIIIHSSLIEPSHRLLSLGRLII